MTPRDLGFPEQYESFRPAQEEALDFALTSEERYCGIGAPPGVGKSGIAYALAKLLGGRTVILTATLGLQDQYLEFSDIVDMRGRSNFHCWEGGTCEDGGRLGCGDREGCPYMGRLREFNAADIGVTSYAWWLAASQMGNGPAIPDTLICDEAGLAFDWLSRALDFHITEREARAALVGKPCPGESIDEWVKLAPDICASAESGYNRIKALMRDTRSPAARERYLRELKALEGFVDRAKKLSMIHTDNWVCTRIDGDDEGRVWKFECVWPGQYRERLFRGVKRVVLMSASLRPKTIGLLGVSRSDIDFREWGRQFPAINGPVLWIPTVRMGSKMSDAHKGDWLARIGQIFEWGDDRKGLTHTVSFARAKEIAQSTLALRHKVILNGAADPDSGSAREAYSRHIKSPDPTVLISPSFSTGWDFKGRAAEWQIISKIAFPDMRSKVMVARNEVDHSYGNYLAAQDLVQACGRITRTETDRGVTLVIDDHVQWFLKAAADHMPKWYRVRKETELPRPLPKL